MSKNSKSKKPKNKALKIIKRVVLLVFALLFLAALIYMGPKILRVTKLAKYAKEYADSSTESTFKESKTTIIYDVNGNQLCTMKNSKDMYYVEFKDIPSSLVDAFVVMEDRDFYKHKGVDYKAIIRAMIANSKSDEIVQGASTITQQLARNIFLSQEVTWERKIEEMFLARDLEKKYSKDQILEFYLNNIYFGNGYYGVEAAAKGYFNKSVGELSLSEQAFIAAIPNNPTRYNPLTNYDNTVGRRDLILKELYAADYINTMNYYSAIDEIITVEKQKVETRNNSVETYARHCATESLMNISGFITRNNFDSEDDYNSYKEYYEKYYTQCQQKLLSGGYSVYTSIDMNVQEKLQEAVDNNLSGYKGVSDSGVYELQAAATCIDNSTGNVVAIVGSRSQELEGYTLNRAYQSYRQPGSSVKPLIVYLPYLQKGNNPDTIVADEKIDGGPSNADGTFLGNITLRDAVKWSRNTVAWKIYQEITPRAGSSFLISMGFHKIWMDKDYNAASLGGFTYGVSTEEMAGAYATIANDGVYRKPTCVIKIADATGSVIVNESYRGVRVYEVNACRMMTDMLKTVVESGTGTAAYSDNIVVAGKTGTTNKTKDLWFCGYSSYYTTSVWIGYDYPKDMSGTSVNAGTIFKNFMVNIHENLPKKDFPKYSGNTTQTETQSETQPETESITETQSETESASTEKTSGQATTKANGNTSSGGNNGNNSNSRPGSTQGEWDATTSGGDRDAETVTDRDATIKGGDW